MSQRVLASAPPHAVAAYRAAHRLRGRGGGDAREKRSREADPEARFLRHVGAVRVQEPQVAAPLVAAARPAASRAASELGTTEPDIRWFRSVKGGKPARGWFDGAMSGSVWISASLGVQEVPSVVAHESKHRADYLEGRAMTEKAARAFAARYEPPSDGRAFAPRPTQFVHPHMRS